MSRPAGEGAPAAAKPPRQPQPEGPGGGGQPLAAQPPRQPQPEGPGGGGQPLAAQPPPAPGADHVFDALADATRRTVLRTVADEGPLTATELAGRLPVSRQAVAKHLEVLREAGLVTSTREGRDVRFSFHAGPLEEAVGWIAAVGARWDRRLADLQRRLAR